jgi:hypothetical protein
MTTFTDRIAILVEAADNGASAFFTRFAGTATAQAKAVEGEFAAAGTNAGNSFGNNLSNSAAAGIATLLAAAAAFKGAQFFDEAAHSAVSLQKAEAGLAAQIQATGGAAGVSVSGVNALSDSIQKQDVIFSGTVKSAASMLLTYDQIKNKAGAGNDIFNRTLQVSAALSNVFGFDLTQSVQILGRALENPVSGLQALQRAKVGLDNTTKTEVTTLAKEGDTLGAQRVLLDDLAKRYLTLGATLGQNDPFQKFDVAMQGFKQQVGTDILPLFTVLLRGAGDLASAFGYLPGPIRATAEAAALLGIAAVPIVLLKTALGSLSAIAANTAPAIEANAAASLADAEAKGVDVDAIVANTAATDQWIFTGQGVIPVLEGQNAAITAQNALLADNTAERGAISGIAADTALGGAGIGLGGIGLALGAGFASFAGTKALLDSTIGATHHSFDQLIKDTNQVKSSLESVANDSAWDKLIHIHNSLTSVADVKTLNAGFENILNTQGIDAAALAYGRWVNQLEAAGVPLERISSQTEPFLNMLQQAGQDAQGAADGTQSFADALNQLDAPLSKLQARLGINDKIYALQDAQTKLLEDQQTAAGTGQKFADATDRITNAQNTLKDAYYSETDATTTLTDAQHKLMEAQQALDEYNSPRGQTERNLRVAIIADRVETTPSGELQKQLDLMTEQDNNAHQQQQLHDAVTSAQQGVTRAFQDQKKSVDAVSKAEYDLQKAVNDRKTLQATAAKDAERDYNKEQEAAAALGLDIIKQNQDLNISDTRAQAFLTTLLRMKPGGDVYKAVDAFWKMWRVDNIQPASGAPGLSDQALAGANTNPRITAELNAIAAGKHPKVSPGDAALFHGLGIPGYDQGGIVPGPLGGPQLAIVHGGERILTPGQQGAIHQTNHFYGDTPSTADLEYANRQLGWRLSRMRSV